MNADGGKNVQRCPVFERFEKNAVVVFSAKFHMRPGRKTRRHRLGSDVVVIVDRLIISEQNQFFIFEQIH